MDARTVDDILSGMDVRYKLKQSTFPGTIRITISSKPVTVMHNKDNNIIIL